MKYLSRIYKDRRKEITRRIRDVLLMLHRELFVKERDARMLIVVKKMGA